MKFYTSNSPEVVNSQARDPEPVIIPPFHFKGTVLSATSDPWPVRYPCMITGGNAITKTTGSTALGITIYKNNLFEDDLVIATGIIPALGGQISLTMSAPMLGHHLLSSSDNVTVKTSTASGHIGVVVQLYAERIN